MSYAGDKQHFSDWSIRKATFLTWSSWLRATMWKLCDETVVPQQTSLAWVWELSGLPVHMHRLLASWKIRDCALIRPTKRRSAYCQMSRVANRGQDPANPWKSPGLVLETNRGWFSCRHCYRRNLNFSRKKFGIVLEVAYRAIRIPGNRANPAPHRWYVIERKMT